MTSHPQRDAKVSERLEQAKALFEAAKKQSVSQAEVIRLLMKHGLQKKVNA